MDYFDPGGAPEARLIKPCCLGAFSGSINSPPTTRLTMKPVQSGRMKMSSRLKLYTLCPDRSKLTKSSAKFPNTRAIWSFL